LIADDEEGLELASPSDARQEAVAAIRTILAEELLGGIIDLSGCVVIPDEADSPLLIVPFSEAVTVRGGAR
jgi:hypothetical protein